MVRTRPSTGLVNQLARYSAATIHEASGRRGALEACIKPLDRSMSLCGPAFTVRCAPRDNLMLQLAIALASPGDVLVVSGGDYGEAGFFGDVLGNACIAKGIGGLVIDSGVRDTEQLRRLEFPVFSASISIKGTVKESVYPLNEPIVVGGELVNPGDVMRGDADGVVVVRREELEETIRSSQERVENEEEYIAAYRGGKGVIEMCGLEAVFRAKGLVIDHDPDLGSGFRQLQAEYEPAEAKP